MNEKIKQLAEQAGIHFHNGGTLDAGPNGIAKFVLYSDMETFAELIVVECAMVVVTELEGKVGSAIADATANRLEEHFGVEE